MNSEVIKYFLNTRNNIFLLFVLATQCALSQTEKSLLRYSSDTWLVEQGLPENNISSILQSPDGYLWLASQTIIQFDGKNFTPIVFPDSIGKNISPILSLFLGTDQTMWAGTYGSGIVKIKNGSTSLISEKDGLSSNTARTFVQDSSGALWIGTNNGLDIYNDGSFTHHYNSENGLPANPVWCLFKDSKNRMWVGTYGGGVALYENGSFKIYSTKQGLLSNFIMSINESVDGTIWIGTDGGGAAAIRNSVITNYTKKQGLLNTVVWTIYRDKVGMMWFGTYGGGVHRFINGKFESFQKNEMERDFVTCIGEDFEGNIWYGTSGNGLHRLKYGNFITYTEDQNLVHNNVRTVFKDSKGNIWCGSVGGGISKFNNGKFTNYTTKQGLSSDFIWTMAEDRKGNIWIGTGGSGLDKFSNGRFTTYTTEDGLSNNFVLSLLEDSHGSLWIGTNGGGLDKFVNGSFTHYSTKNGLSGDFVSSLFEDSSGTLWVGTNNGGLTLINDGKLKTIHKSDSLHNDFIEKIFQDSEGTLWLFSNGGFTRYKNGQFKTYESKEGIFSTRIIQVVEDKQKNFWFTTNKGLYLAHKENIEALLERKKNTLSVIHFDKNDGLLSSEFNAGFPAAVIDDFGMFWFPSTRGIAVVDPTRIQYNPIPPPVYIQKFLTDGITITSKEQFQLSTINEKFEFHYGAINFSAPEKIQFKYKLEGFDRDWIDAEQRRVAFYTNLPKGNYIFHVIAANNDGIWNETGASLSFQIFPQFYETPPFYIGVISLISMVILFILQIRERASKERERTLIKVVDERTSNLREEKEKTEQALRQTEEARLQLLESEERYRNLVENINEAFFVVDQSGRMTYASPNLSRETGYSHEELLGISYLRLVSEKDRKQFIEMFRLYNQQRTENIILEFRGRRKDGSEEWVELTTRIIRDENGEIIHFHNLMRKITDKKLAQEALKQSEERLRKFFENDLTGDFSCATDGTIIQVNQSFVKMFGFDSFLDARAINISQLYSSHDEWKNILTRIQKVKLIEYQEVELCHQNEMIVYAIQNIIGTFDESGNLVELTGYIFDNTALKKMEQQFIEAQKMESIGTLAGGIAHDFNNILAIIIGYANVIQREKNDPLKIQHRTEAIVKAGERGSDLVRQLLTFARKSEVVFSYVDVNKIASEVNSMLCETLPKNISLRAQLRSGVPLLWGFGTHVHQALLNLCLNARDAMPNGGEILMFTDVIQKNNIISTTMASKAEVYVTISVLDTGTGMDEEIKNRIYDPFFTTKERGSGTGLGLSVLYGIMQHHKGFIDLQTSPGSGSQFTLYFPVPEEMTLEIENSTNEIEKNYFGKETVLIVEDEEMISSLLQETLSEYGYTVYVAVDGEDALQKFKIYKNEISIIISDLDLPKLGGWEAFQLMKNVNPSLKGIFVSGYISEQTEIDIAEAHSDLVHKPYSLNYMCKRLREALDRKIDL